MKRRATEFIVLAVGMLVIVSFAIAGGARPTSTPSTYDGGPFGYELLYNVLAREQVAVSRLRLPLGLAPRDIGVLVMTRGPLDGGIASAYDPNDLKRIETLVKRGGTFVAFLPSTDKMPKAFAALPKGRVLRYDVMRYDNAMLAKHPRDAATIYSALAGRGPVYFDEHVQGYDDTRSFWSVLPPAVHDACFLALAMLLLLLIDANAPFVPPVALEPPSDRDSSAYIASMAALLRRGHAARAAIARFARTYPRDEELARFAQLSNPSDAVLIRAAQIAAARRKDHP